MKHLLALLILALATLCASAVPANPTPHVFTQPDGSQVTLRLCGDEFYHFTTTTDGYTVVQRSDGAWVYAIRNGATLAPSAVVAHDIGERTADETTLTAVTPMHLTDLVAVEASKQARAAAHHPQAGCEGTARCAPANGPQRATTFDVSKFRGLIILVEPSDVEFSMGDRTHEFYDTLVNAKNFTGFDYGDYGQWTGSVRDYYYDNSWGKFDPEFDVVGPVKVNYASTQFRAEVTNAFQVALNKINKDVDFSRYDGDEDGCVDMVFFIVAGYGSNYAGNNEGFLWPHMGYQLSTFKYDQKFLRKYACSVEIGGNEGYGYVDGVGTICHEFSHVLGLEDLYDTDYGTNGLAHHPGGWDIMASGSFLNNGRTPPGYSFYERYSLSFATPKHITNEGTYILTSLGDSNEGLILRTPVDNEFFIMENRQKTSKWDAYLPGHGLLVTRVDSTNTMVWHNDQINTNAKHMYYELLRAGNSKTGDLASDPFPGTMGITRLTNTTQPNLRTWDRTPNPLTITDIAEQDGVITFQAAKPAPLKAIAETFDLLPITDETPIEVQGDIAKWKLAQCHTTEISDNNHAVVMKNPSVLLMLTPVYYDIQEISFDVDNTSSNNAKLQLQYTTDNGNTWINCIAPTGEELMEIDGNTTLTSSWMVTSTADKPIQFRILMKGGSTNHSCIIDNFTIFYLDNRLKGDVNDDGNVDIDDVNAIINIILQLTNPSAYDSVADVNASGQVDIDDVNELINILLK